MAVDHCSFECVGLHAGKSGNRFEALEAVRQGVKESLGGGAPGAAEGLALRHDHGTAYLSDAFQGELAFLGMRSSPSFEPEGNGCAKRFIRILKEKLFGVRTFKTLEELRPTLIEFMEQCNRRWILERHGYLTPRQVAAAAAQRLDEPA